MIALVQVVSSSSVQIANQQTTQRSIGKGLVVFLGISVSDTETDLEKVLNKLLKLRVFSDEKQKMNLDLATSGGEVLLISQFTLLGDLKRNNRPNFTQAAEKELAFKLYDQFAVKLRESGVPTTEGYFGEHMEITSNLTGPVTIIMDSNKI